MNKILHRLHIYRYFFDSMLFFPFVYQYLNLNSFVFIELYLNLFLKLYLIIINSIIFHSFPLNYIQSIGIQLNVVALIDLLSLGVSTYINIRSGRNCLNCFNVSCPFLTEPIKEILKGGNA